MRFRLSMLATAPWSRRKMEARGAIWYLSRRMGKAYFLAPLASSRAI